MKIRGLTEKAAQLLQDKDDAIDELNRIETQLAKYGTDPQSFVGRFFKKDNGYYNEEYCHILGIDRGAYIMKVVKFPADGRSKANDGNYPSLLVQRETPGYFFDHDATEITDTEYMQAYKRFTTSYKAHYNSECRA